MSVIIFILFLYFLFKFGFKLFVGVLGFTIYFVACLIGILALLRLLLFDEGLLRFGGGMLDFIGVLAFVLLIRIAFSN